MTDVGYQYPSGFHQDHITVVNSQFITSIDRATSVEEARSFIKQIRDEMNDASHHVYAFRIGHGNSIVEGMSDDGEPSGTAGPPTLAVLRGSAIGDIVLVTTRYFGGTKLGTGGLVRAYSESARTALQSLKTELNVPKQLLGIDVPYSLYETVLSCIKDHLGMVSDEVFSSDVMILATFPTHKITDFTDAVINLTAGQVVPINLSDDE